MHCAITAGFGSLRKNAQTPACKSDSDSDRDRDSDRVLSRGARKRGGGWGGLARAATGVPRRLAGRVEPAVISHTPLIAWSRIESLRDQRSKNLGWGGTVMW